jgi:glycosyltransferase involved in cell wall biosynthesis
MSRDVNPLVTVIIPFFNGEQFIREAVDSVFAQTHQSWELILIDDGSTDASTHIAQEYEAAYPDRIRYLEHEAHRNLGQSAARNLGMRHAKGQFFAFLDCDDVWLPMKLERQVAILLAHQEASMVFGAAQYWHAWNREQSSEADRTPDLGVPGDALYQPPDLLRFLHPLGDGAAPCPSDLMIRRDLFSATAGFSEEFRGVYGMYEDQVFLCKVYVQAAVFVSHETWTRYRIHPNSCMSSVQGAGLDTAVRLFFLTYLDAYLTEAGVQDEAIWGLLQQALRPYGRTTSRQNSKGSSIRELKWSLRFTSQNQARLLFPPEDPTLVRVEIAKAGSPDPWDIQLNQPDLRVKQGDSYRLDFRIRSDRNRTVNFGFSRAREPWDNLGIYRTISTGPEWTSQSFEFVATSNEARARLHFDLGGEQISVDLKSIQLFDVSKGQPVEPDFVVHGLYPIERWELTPRNAATAAARPVLSVVIPTFQRRDLVVRHVKALADQDFAQPFEVIVVVDGSTDGTVDALRDLKTPFPLTVLDHQNQGLSVTRNRGASAAQGDVLVFLDDDMEAHPRLLTEHAISHAAGADVVLGHIPLHPDSPRNFLSREVGLWAEDRARRLLRPGTELPLHDLMLGQASIRRDLFHKLQGFDTDFTRDGSFGDEDLDLGYRVMAAGHRVVFNPYAISYQNYIVTPRHHLRQVRQAGQADVTFAKKHPDQTAVIFQDRPGRWTRPEVWRALAALRPVSAPFTATFRWLVMALVDNGLEGAKAKRLFYEVYEMEYWRGVREAGGRPRMPSVRVLAYHAIRDLKGAPVLESYGIPPAQFRKQLKALLRCGFHFIDAGQFLDFLSHGAPLPNRAVLLTFDDCYDDLLEFALPILKDLDIPAVAFAVSSRLGQTNDWDSAKDAPSIKLLDVNGISALARNGIELGGHSRTHPMLSQLVPDEVDAEVAGCIEDLKRAGLQSPRMFAYPFGDWSPVVRKAVRLAGIQAAFTVKPGEVRRGQDPFALPRIEILREDNGWRFLWKVLTAA